MQVGYETALSPSGKLGVWWFIASEIMVFGGLIGSYVLFRVAHGGWNDQASHVNWRLGAINTLVLVTSSLTMILALNAVRIERRQRAARFLLVTVLLGFTFLGIKSIEYTHELSEGFTPTSGMFWSFYYIMTGLHGRPRARRDNPEFDALHRRGPRHSVVRKQEEPGRVRRTVLALRRCGLDFPFPAALSGVRRTRMKRTNLK